ncbi:hypothetical protein LDENG_00169230 [Lucifuga dentata]|nr:hypothetical protein LDENG_00169230 [Lucifuga dentata]
MFDAYRVCGVCRLSGCRLTIKGCDSLTPAVLSNHHLRQLDLSNNHPQVSRLQLDQHGSRWFNTSLRKYALELTLDLNTVNRNLLLSDDSRTVTNEEEEQSYPDDLDRLTHIHTFYCNFKEPVYPAFRIRSEFTCELKSSLTLCQTQE